MDLVFLAIFVAVFGWVIYIFFTKRGRGFLFGGRIVKTFDPVAAKGRLLSHKFRVHAVASGSSTIVGLEISSSSVASFSMIPISLPAAEARLLGELLIEASNYQHSGGASQ